jgi:hypothetical protein
LAVDKSNYDETSVVNPAAEEGNSFSQLDLPKRISNLLTQAGITDIEALNLRMETDPGTILAITGIGPQSMVIIKDALGSVGTKLLGDEAPILLPAEVSKPAARPKKKKEKVEKETKKGKIMAKDKKTDKKKTKKKADKEKVKKSKTKDKVKDTKKGKKEEKKVKKEVKKTKKKDTKKKNIKKKEAKKKKGKKK